MTIISISCSENTTPITEKEPEIVPFVTVIYSAIGDVPYKNAQKEEIKTLITKHNSTAKSDFLIHLGYIKLRSAACDESVYQEVSSLLKSFSVPTFSILGDNEFNDSSNPEEGLNIWKIYSIPPRRWSFLVSKLSMA